MKLLGPVITLQLVTSFLIGTNSEYQIINYLFIIILDFFLILSFSKNPPCLKSFKEPPFILLILVFLVVNYISFFNYSYDFNDLNIVDHANPSTILYLPHSLDKSATFDQAVKNTIFAIHFLLFITFAKASKKNSGLIYNSLSLAALIFTYYAGFIKISQYTKWPDINALYGFKYRGNETSFLLLLFPLISLRVVKIFENVHKVERFNRTVSFLALPIFIFLIYINQSRAGTLLFCLEVITLFIVTCKLQPRFRRLSVFIPALVICVGFIFINNGVSRLLNRPAVTELRKYGRIEQIQVEVKKEVPDAKNAIYICDTPLLKGSRFVIEIQKTVEGKFLIEFHDKKLKAKRTFSCIPDFQQGTVTKILTINCNPESIHINDGYRYLNVKEHIYRSKIDLDNFSENCLRNYLIRPKIPYGHGQIKVLRLKYKNTDFKQFPDLNSFSSFIYSNLHSRLQIFESGFKSLKENYLFGTGPGTWSAMYLFYRTPGDIWEYWQHCDPLQLFIEYGLIGIIMFVYFANHLVKHPPTSELNYLRISLVFLLLHSFLDFPLQLAVIYIYLIPVFCVYKSHHFFRNA